MSAQDLTRYNRAGLRRFQYVDGNAATYLELLREALAQRFPEWGEERVHLAASTLAREQSDPLARRDRILQQYRDGKRDWGWELARTFSRSCHVLSRYIDAYANEGFLETATQWDLLRRLVEMLGYQATPPASASTVLVLEAKPAFSGVVRAGLAFKSSPPSGSPPLVFESLTDVAIDHRLNALRLAGWDRSEQTFDPFADGARDLSPWVAPAEAELSAGQPAILLQAADARVPQAASDVRAVELARVDSSSGEVALASGSSAGAWLRGYTELRAAPKKVVRPHLNGPGLIELEREHALAPGDVVAWRAGSAWAFDVVTAAAGKALLLSQRSSRPSGALYRAAAAPPIMRTVAPLNLEFRAPFTLLAAAYRGAGNTLGVLSPDAFTKPVPGGDQREQGYLRKAADFGADFIWMLTAGMPEVGRVATRVDTAGRFTFDGSPAGIASGDWVVAEYDGGALRAPMHVARVGLGESTFELTLEDPAQFFVRSVPSEALRALCVALRRAEAVLDQPVWRQLRLVDLFAGSVLERPTTAVEGVGERGRTPASYSDRLASAGVESVRQLAELAPSTRVAGVPEVLLRELRTRAELIAHFPRDVAPVSSLLGARVADILALESGISARAADGLALTRVYAAFKHVLRPTRYERNALPVGAAPHELALGADELPSVLKAGRVVLLEQETSDGFRAAREATVLEVTGNRLRLAPPITASEGFTLGNLVIRGNTVLAGHGEARAERLLGTGNAALTNQTFDMGVVGVSFVTDSTMPAGVRADVEVHVGGQRWREVGSLRDSGPADPHYTVRVSEDGSLVFAFGDGENGRRLPSGPNNVRVRYRVGSGLAGNLPAGSLSKLGKPHAIVKSVRQPLPATGGNDLESVTSLRENAPSSLLALERAVSLGDYGSLSASQASLWQAKAFARTTSLGRSQNIDVVVVPAGGAPLDGEQRPVVTADFLQKQREFLQLHAPPGVAVSTRLYTPILVDLSVTVRVKSAEFELGATTDRVRAALWNAFSLRRRKLGQALQRSDVYRIVESVLGVENSDCALAVVAIGGMAERARRVVVQSGVVQAILPAEDQIVYLDAERSTVRVSAKEYEL